MTVIGRTLVALIALTGLSVEVCAQQRQRQPQSGFRVCNQTGDEIEVAKALNTGASDGRSQIIISEGWYRLPPSACTFLWSGRLQYRYYLVYAQNKKSGREWAGNIPLCVSPEAFTIRSDTCGGAYQQRMFHQVDVGNERNFWTHTFHP